MLNGTENNQNGEKSGNFGLPEDYFQKSAASLINRIEWLEEHQDYKILTSFKDKQPFYVPGGYFESLDKKIELITYPQLLLLKKIPHGFNAPMGYFNMAEVRELGQVIAEEEQFHIRVPKKNSFVTERGYFEANEAKLKKILASPKHKTKIVRLFSVRRLSAVAAVLIIALGFWFYNFYFNVANTTDCGTMACIDSVELLKARAIENLETDELYELVNSKKLEEHLNTKVIDKKQKRDSANALPEDAVDDLLDGI